MKCDVCGENMPADAVFCPKCGERRKSEAAAGESPLTGTDRFKQTMASKMIDPKADEPEKVLWQGSYSPRAMVGGWLLSLVVTIVAFVVGGLFFPGVGLFVAAAIALAFWGGHLALLIYQRLSHEYKLTNQRFIHGHGVFRRVTDRIEVIDIDDVQVTQGFIERFLGVGTIKILSSDITSPMTTLAGINEVTRIATLIDDTRRTERRKRSVHIESI